MTDPAAVGTASACPPWCHVEHGKGRTIHRTCTGQILWRNGSVAVEIAQYRGSDFIVLSNFTDEENAVGANLTLVEARELRAALGLALGLSESEAA
jgi:hypothetical protein